MGRRRRRKPSAVSNSFVVAAYNSRDTWSADYVCSGAADEVEINLAFAALGVAEGVVVLMEGDFTLAASIAFTANNQTLRGQGRSTYIDGTALGAGVHAIVLSGLIDCGIWDLAVETNAGGGNVTHGVFIEDGADNFHVRNVTIVNSDANGIHIEGTTINLGHIHLCHIEAADGYGIAVSMDALNFMNRLHVEDNDVLNCGSRGIYFLASGGNFYCKIVNNIVFSPTGTDGIRVVNSDYSMVRGNVVLSCGQYGIDVNNTLHAQVIGNICQGNTDAGINLGTTTGVEVIGNICEGNGNDGISVLSGDYTVVTGNSFNGNGRRGIYLSTSDHCTVTGNACNLNAWFGIELSGSDHCTVTGNTCNGNDSADTATYDGINLDTCDRALVLGNQCQDNDRWGIMVEDGSNWCKVSNNYTNGNTAGSIRVNAVADNNNEIIFNTVEEGAPADAGTLTRASGNYDPSANAYIAPIGAAPF